MNDLGYKIHIEPGGYARIASHFPFEKYTRVAVCVDPQVHHYHQSLFSSTPYQTHVLAQAGEAAKDFSAVQDLCTFFKNCKLDRHSVVLAVGGGAIGDVVGFAASIFMRGISVLHVPTTLLSMVDSSVGAKTAINFSGVKNLVGSFHPPAGVLIDTNFLRTLPADEFNCGCAEIIKHGIIADAQYFECVSKYPCKGLSAEDLCKIISGSVKIKSEVVLKDPKESAERKILNFGHTLGHCIEAYAKVPHGKAVAIGMMLEASLAAEMFSDALELPKIIAEALKNNDLPSSIAEVSAAIPWDAFYQLLLLDKKNKDGKILFALPPKLGACAFDVAVPVEKIKNVVEKTQ